MNERLLMKNISKSFPGVKALSSVNFELKPGEVHVLVGENGAGKSTLMKILAGIYQADQGIIELDGQEVHIYNTKIANELGIFIIHQELNLIPDLTVAENIFLGRKFPKSRKILIDWGKLYSDTERVLNQLSLVIDPKILVKNLSIAQQQMVEIAKVISESNPKIIIMDEPTATITEKETEELFHQIRNLVKRNVSIIYISHRLEEINVIGDRVTIMRDGQIVGASLSISNLNKNQIIKMMVGREIGNQYPKKIYPIGKKILCVDKISSIKGNSLSSFELYSGEVLGFAGLIGSGRTELMRSIFGADKRKTGKIIKDGIEIKIESPYDAVNNGIALLTEDRRLTGLLLQMPVYCNITLAAMRSYIKLFLINHKKEKVDSQKYISDLNIKTPRFNSPTSNLSGGNQQKVIFARWLCKNAEILILDEPTRGIDVNAKVEIYEIINSLAAVGKAIILISSDLPEVIGMSDRIAVMSEGNITGILNREEFTQEKIMELAVQYVPESVKIQNF